MGTPEFARRPLAYLAGTGHELAAVVTGPDKPAGRGRKLMPTPVRVEAERHNIPVLTPKSLKSKKLHGQLSEIAADLFVVVAFRILPQTLFELPRLGAINIHGSLLPKYRGAAPINWAIMNGESETGLSSFFLKQEVDSGDIIAQEKIGIDENDSFDSLYLKMADMAGPFLARTLNLIESGKAEPIPQIPTDISEAPKLKPEDGRINFDLPVRNVYDFVRGLSSKPAAYSKFRGEKLKILGCQRADIEISPDTQPGSIIPDKKRLLIACSEGAIEVTRLIPQGKKEMDGRSFVNGLRPSDGEIVGETIVEGHSKK